ncbi:MAG TPA: citrate/2-methylcitrate synthase [Dehalococcoidia bacterium]|nr:citrate/2-methylcitrate synthase [Dehalococcoidia bacterium]
MEATLARGLKDVVLDTTESSFIDGEVGVLLYRGYNIHDLAQNSNFEEVCYLLLYGTLPTQEQLTGFHTRLVKNRALPAEVIDVIRLVKDAHPMDVLRTAASAVAAFDVDVEDNSRDANIRKSERLISQFPSIVAAHHRIRNGQQPVAPRDDLSHAANFLYMLEGKEPPSEAVEAMDLDFLLHAEHGANASAFAARVTASTLSDMHSSIVTAIGTLKGPLHGGAAEAVQKMTSEIGDPSNAQEYIKQKLANHERIMGFGHRVYRAEDPRARHMREKSRQLGEKLGHSEWYQILTQVEKDMAPYQSRGIFVNVDFYAGSVYALLGLPEDLFVPIFAIGRIPGWCVEILEQYDNNMLIRPLLKYTGPMNVPFVPLEKR